MLFIINVDWYFSLHWMERARAARQAGFEVHVATCCTDNRHFDRWAADGITAHHVPLTKISANVFKDMAGLYKLKRLMSALSPTFVHCITVKPNVYGGLLAIVFGIPSVKSVTGLGSVFSNRGLRFHFLRGLILMGYRLIDRFGKGAFIFENDEDRSFFNTRAVTVRQPSRLIRGAGVCLDTFRFRKPATRDRVTVLFAGRLLQDKGLALLVQAVALARQHIRQLDLMVAGIHDRHAIDAISPETINGWHRRGLVTWLGERQDMPAVIAGADIVALPTRYGEGVPRILLEAAATGRALVASDVAGCRDVVMDGINGLLIPPDDVQALSRAIVQLAENPTLRNRMGKAGSTMVAQRFAKSLVVEKTLEVYEKVIAGR